MKEQMLSSFCFDKPAGVIFKQLSKTSFWHSTAPQLELAKMFKCLTFFKCLSTLKSVLGDFVPCVVSIPVARSL